MPEVAEQATEAKTPAHRWTHDGSKVLLVKCVDKGGKSTNGFQWPATGKTVCPKAAQDRQAACNTSCESGGLFGWPWAINIGGGKEPDYRSDWLVFAADPQDVIDLDGKAKAVGEVEVVYYGDALGAIMHTFQGRTAWVRHNASSSAASSGDSSSAASSGDRSSAASSGDRSSAASSGYSSSAASSGDRSSAASSGYRSSAASSGDRSSAASSGDRSIAAITGEYSTIEVGAHALGAVTAHRWLWKVHSGAVVACRWQTKDKSWPHTMLDANALGLTDGQMVKIECGQVVSEWSNG